jgi:hypothetical protein
MKDMKNIPQVRFEYAWLLSDAASTVLNEKWGDGKPLRSYKYYEGVAHKYAKWWQSVGDNILEGLCDITGLSFRQNTIDVHVAPWFYALSSPMVIGVIFKDEDGLINIVSHEIIHRLLTDNTTYDYDYNFVAIWRDMFGEELSKNTLVHVPVHAIMKKLYVDILKRPELVELDKKSVSNNPDYTAAWEYVDRVGHEEIIRKLSDHADNFKLRTLKAKL